MACSRRLQRRTGSTKRLRDSLQTVVGTEMAPANKTGKSNDPPLGASHEQHGLPDIGHVYTAQVHGLEIRFTRGGQSDGVPILLTSPWPESIYAYRAIWPKIEGLGPLI